jgi:hypothetical protein
MSDMIENRAEARGLTAKVGLEFTNPQVLSTVGLPRTPIGDGSVSEPLVQFGYEKRAEALSKADLFGIKPCCDNWNDFLFMSMGQYILNSPGLSRYVRKRDRICIEDRIIKKADTGIPQGPVPDRQQQKFPPKPLTVPSQPDYDYGYDDAATCHLDSDVVTNRCTGLYAVEVIPSGPSPHTVAWSNNPFNLNLSNFIGPDSGFSATVSVTDANGCVAELEFNLDDLAAPMNVTGDVQSTGGGQVLLTSETSGGYPEYTYAWYVLSEEGWIPLSGQTGSSITVDSGTPHKIVVTDIYECEATLEYMGI